MTSPDMPEALLAEAMDFLTRLESMLTCATVTEQTVIETAAETIYGPNEGNHYTKLTTETTGLRDRIYQHIDR